jgi:hypothetical protein
MDCCSYVQISFKRLGFGNLSTRVPKQSLSFFDGSMDQSNLEDTGKSRFCGTYVARCCF